MLQVSVSANAVVEAADSPPNIQVAQVGTFPLALASYSNQQPLRIRVQLNHSLPAPAVDYSVQVVAPGPLRIEGVIGQRGIWPDNADTVRIGPGSSTSISTVFMGVSNLYNGNQPGSPKLYVIDQQSQTKLAISGYPGSNEQGLDVLTAYFDDLFTRPGTYRLLVETSDGRSALAPFYVQVID